MKNYKIKADIGNINNCDNTCAAAFRCSKTVQETHWLQ